MQSTFSLLMGAVGTNRLMKEYNALRKDPVPNIFAECDPKNIFFWHFVLIGPEDTPYQGGVYYGHLIFPKEYPFKPPSVKFMVPQGRFHVGKEICMSNTNFHAESHSPFWGPRLFLLGLLSFLTSEENTYGAIESSDEERRRIAHHSLEECRKHKKFLQFFEELANQIESERASSSTICGGVSSEGNVSPQEVDKQGQLAASGQDSGTTSTVVPGEEGEGKASLGTALCNFTAFVAFFSVFLYLVW